MSTHHPKMGHRGKSTGGHVCGISIGITLSLCRGFTITLDRDTQVYTNRQGLTISFYVSIRTLHCQATRKKDRGPNLKKIKLLIPPFETKVVRVNRVVFHPLGYCLFSMTSDAVEQKVFVVPDLSIKDLLEVIP